MRTYKYPKVTTNSSKAQTFDLLSLTSSSMPLLPPLSSLSLPLILLLIAIQGTCSASSSKSPCTSSSHCGNITVDYPFSLYDPYNTTNSSYCGYPGLQIYCYDSKFPVLFLSSDNYTITGIDYLKNTISLVDTDILLQNTSTPKVDHNVSLTPNTWLNYTDLVINITFFLSCPKFESNISSSSIGPIDSILGKYSYVSPTTAIPSEEYEWARECEEVIVAPVLGPIVNSEVANLSNTYGSVLLDGFQLEWSNVSEYCLQCEKRGGQCGYDVTGNFTFIPTCFCCGT